MIPKECDGRYEVIKTLHKTAATAVVLVRHRQLGDLRIFKSVSKEDQTSPLLLSEANILSGFRHPGIPTIYDIGETETLHYIVEEYVKGQSLQEYLICHHNLTRKEVALIAIQLCEIIGTLHTKGESPVVYRDLKPEHIIITADRVKLIDYGTAVEISSADEVIDNYGTRSFASPEQLNGGPIDVRSDIFAIGKIISFMLTYAKSSEKRGIGSIARKACANDPDDRFSSCQEMQQRLQVVASMMPHNTKTGGHLLTKIAVVGASSACGCTHFSVALCIFLNSCGIRAYYKSCDATVKHMANQSLIMKQKDGVLYHENFYGLMDFGEAVECKKPPKGVIIQDLGVDEPEDEVDYVFYVVSGRLWQLPESLPEFIKQDHVIIISNFSSKSDGIMLAKRAEKRVYTFPLQSNPLMGSKDAEKVLQRIFKEEVKLDLEKKKRLL